MAAWVCLSVVAAPARGQDAGGLDAAGPAPAESSKDAGSAAGPPGPPEVPAGAIGQPAVDHSETDPTGQPVTAVSFNCDLELCDNPVTVDKFVHMSGLYVGMTFSPRALRRAEDRLAKTGFFAKIETTTSLTDDGVAVSMDAQGAVLIRDVDFAGVDGPPFESELKKLLIFRQGQPYRGDKSKSSTQLRTLREKFEEEGYFGTEISMYVRPSDADDHLVDVTFQVDKGQELDICDIGIRGLRSIPYDEAREQLLSSYSVLTRRLEVFDPTFTTRVFKQGRQALINHYRQRGFFQARIVGARAQKDPEHGCVTILVDIDEGPNWKLKFTGDVQFSKSELREELPFYESGYVDAEEIRRAERAIRALYETHGHPFARVHGTRKRRDRLDRRITFDIDAGPRLEIGELVLHGNDSIDREALLAKFGTRRFGLFAEGGYLQGEQLLGDIKKLEKVYRSRGFLQATVERFALEVLEGQQELRIHIYIDEGERTRAKRLHFEGNRTLTSGILKDELTVQSGTPFVPLEVKADRSRLVQLYSSYGYPMAEVNTTCRTLTGQVVACQAPKIPAKCVARSAEDLDQLCHWSDGPLSTRMCRRIRRQAGCKPHGGIQTAGVTIEHAIGEGPFVRVSEILLKGNFETSSSLIYRELPLKKGDPFDVSKLLEGQGNMRSLGVFDSVSIEAIGLDEQARDDEEATAGLIIDVEESENRYVDFKFGFEGRDLLDSSRRLLLTGEAQYNDDNLFGFAQRFRPRVIGAFDAMDVFKAGAGRAGIAEARSLDQIDYLAGAELIYNHPRFLKNVTGIDKISLTVAPFYLIDLLGVRYDEVLREEWGVRVELRKQLTEILDRLFLSIGIEGKQAALWTPADPTVGGERLFSPRRVTGKLEPELTLDRRDSPLNPTEGYYIQLQPGLITGATLARGAEDAVEDAYLRLLVTTDFYLELLDGVVFGQGLQYGHVLPFFGRDRLITEDERFRLGGAGSLRGFANNTLGPLRQAQPTGGEFLANYNAELRYPLIAPINLYGAVFFDAGVLVDCFSDASNNDERISCYDDAFGDDSPLAKIRTAAGLGLRYLIADQIPVVVDYGMVLDRQPGESFGTVHFNLGYTF